MLEIYVGLASTLKGKGALLHSVCMQMCSVRQRSVGALALLGVQSWVGQSTSFII